MPEGYLKNAEIARRYHVSTATVSRWFRLAQENKNMLELAQIDNKLYALDTFQNHSEFERLAEIGRRYKVSEETIVTEPEPELYKLLTANEIVELIRGIQENNFVDLKYMFIGQGADNYVTLVEGNKIKRNSSYNQQYFAFIADWINDNLSHTLQNESLSIIDMCVGDGEVIKPVLKNLQNLHTVTDYHALDFSLKMLEKNKENISQSFGKTIHKNSKVDLERDSIYRLLDNTKAFTSNQRQVFFNIGDTFNNFHNPATYIKNVAYAMHSGDLFVLSTNTDVAVSAVYLTGRNKNNRKYRMYMDYQHDYSLFKLLGISTDEFVSLIELEDNKYTRGFQFNKTYRSNIRIDKQNYPLTIESGSIINILKLETYTPEWLANKFAKNSLRIVRYVDNGLCSGIYILQKV